MTAIVERRYSETIHPLHAIVLAGALTLFAAALISDVAYVRSFHLQWQNFASWLVVGAMVLTSVALIFAIVDLAQSHRRAHGIGLYVAVLIVTWIVGFLDALMHARDAWASMPGGLILSVITTVLAAVAVALGFRTRRRVESVL